MSADFMSTEFNPNILHWNADDGYDADADENKYPRRISNALSFGALQLGLIQSKANLAFKGAGEAAAFRLFIHMPGEMQISQRYFQIYPSEATMISIKPKLVTTSRGLRSYTPEKRQCFFNSERQLTFYQIYTQKNCVAECFTFYMKAKFGCVPFYMTSMLF